MNATIKLYREGPGRYIWAGRRYRHTVFRFHSDYGDTQWMIDSVCNATGQTRYGQTDTLAGARATIAAMEVTA